MRYFNKKRYFCAFLVRKHQKKKPIVAHKVNEKLPLECTNIAEVRHEIDNIDFEIIRLLSARTQYVHEVVKYKDGTSSGIEAPDRRAAVISSRREWAEKAGINPDVVGDIYDKLIAYYIEEEKKLVKVS